MSSQFSTNETVSLEKRVDLLKTVYKTTPENINQVYEVEKCAKWIEENQFQKVCLQFPDYLLPDSSEIVYKLEGLIGRKVYILGDTAYESCCIDYTAAKHIFADGIIHFGPTCFSKSENVIPCLKIFEKFQLNVEEFYTVLIDKFVNCLNDVLILVDTPYLYKIANLKEVLKETKFKIYSIEEDYVNINEEQVVYLGENDRKLMNINLTLNPKNLYYFDPKTSKSIETYEQDIKVLKRRNYLIEKIKDSNTIGIVISTLAVHNYLKIIERLKTLIKLHDKKYYVISVGKPNVAKLANFPEVDVFVVVGCAMNEIYENRDFYKPIVTPFDLETSLNTNLPTNIQFSYDFNQILTENNEINIELIENNKTDVSLLTGQIRYNPVENPDNKIKEETRSDDKQIAIRPEGKLVVNNESHGAGFLANRSWQGLEQNLGKNEVQLATKGRKGIAQGYENETQ